mmetsp:Transcript_19294/g.48261  ORF Transcript_19294/g.48261 Transcript_19294/m.48261 type:complete len:734 (+) Transcript_19294:3508-5709(+)
MTRHSAAFVAALAGGTGRGGSTGLGHAAGLLHPSAEVEVDRVSVNLNTGSSGLQMGAIVEDAAAGPRSHNTTLSRAASDDPIRRSLLRDKPVRYYVYESGFLNWRREGCTWGKEKASLGVLGKGTNTRSALFDAIQQRAGPHWGKHASDVFFSERALEQVDLWGHQGAEDPRRRRRNSKVSSSSSSSSTSKHSWRTFDPTEADVFIVPVLLNLTEAVRLGGFLPEVDLRHAGWSSALEPICCDGFCGEDLVRKMDQALGNSEYFNAKNAEKHILVASHYGVTSLTPIMPNAGRASALTFESRNPWHWAPPGFFGDLRNWFSKFFTCRLCSAGPTENVGKRIPDLYVPVVCPGSGGLSSPLSTGLDDEKERAMATRAGFFSMIGKVDHRPAYFLRRCLCEAMHEMPNANVRKHSICASVEEDTRGSSNSFCNFRGSVFSEKCGGERDRWDPSGASGEQESKVEQIGCTMRKSASKYCDAVEKARYTLYASGDSPSSSRLADAIEYGSVPVFLQKAQLKVLPFCSRIPWGEFSVLFPVDGEGQMGHFDASNWGIATWGMMNWCDRGYVAELLGRVAKLKTDEEMRRRMGKYRKYLSWMDEESQAFEMFLGEVAGHGGEGTDRKTKNHCQGPFSYPGATPAGGTDLQAARARASTPPAAQEEVTKKAAIASTLPLAEDEGVTKKAARASTLPRAEEKVANNKVSWMAVILGMVVLVLVVITVRLRTLNPSVGGKIR